MKKETFNKDTGEITLTPPGKLNEMIVIETRRPDGSIRVQHDYQYCTSLTEQHNMHMTDVNYLIEKFKPDELAAYMAAKTQNRQEILNHDFSTEPSLQGAKNYTYQLKKDFDALPDEVRHNFKSPLEFLKFIDNPANAEKMVKLGLITKKQITNLQTPPPNTPPPLIPNPTPST